MERNRALCAPFYHALYRPLRLSREAVAGICAQVMQGAYMGQQLAGCAPEMTLWQFLDSLEGTKEDDR